MFGGSSSSSSSSSSSIGNTSPLRPRRLDDSYDGSSASTRAPGIPPEPVNDFRAEAEADDSELDSDDPDEADVPYRDNLFDDNVVELFDE